MNATPQHDPQHDAQVADRARELVHALLADHGDPVDLSVHDGYVTLQGRVSSDAIAHSLREQLEALPGCRGVFNHVQVQHVSPPQDSDIALRVRNALTAHEDTKPAAIDVLAENGVVTLTGEAGSHWERIVAEDIALGTHGVASVHNHIEVHPNAQPDDDGLARDIHAALAYTRGLRDAPIDVQVTGGKVRIRGEVDTEAQRETVEAVVKRFRVREIRNELQVIRPAAGTGDE